MREPLRGLLTLAWPIVVSRSTQTVVGLADALMVAHLGPRSLAAATTGALDTFLILILPMGTIFIVGSFAAQLFGRGDEAGARRFAVYGLLVAALAGLVAAVVAPNLHPIFDAFATEAPHGWGFLDYEPAMRDEMLGYLAIRLWGTAPAVGLEALGSYYGGVGRPRIPMVANVVAMTSNVALNYALIDGHFGAPAMGVDGAALASALSTGLAFVGLLGWFALSGPRPGFVSRELLRTLRFGLPSGFNWFFEFLAFAYFANVVVVGLGTDTVAALNAVMQINSVAFMPAFGIASAGAILVGQAIGAGKKDDVKGHVRLTLGVAATWQVLVGAVYLIVPSVVFSPFAAEPASRAHLMEIGVRMLMLSAAWQLFDASANVLSEALRAAGDTVVPLLFRFAVAWCVFVPGTWLTVREGGPIAGDLLAVGWLVGYLALLALTLFLRYRTGAWRSLELVEPSVFEPEEAPNHR